MSMKYHHGKIDLLDSVSPLQPLHRLSAHLGGPKIFIKRDDEGGPAGGGNKIRKLERQLHDALTQGADVIILPAHSQSNCARELVGCAARLGLECRIVIKDIVGRDDPDYNSNGNALLMRLMGTQFITIQNERDFFEAMDEVADTCRSQGLTPYILPFGATDSLGIMGSMACGHEIFEQSQSLMGSSPTVIAVASGSCGTQAGLITAALSTQTATHVQGFSVLKDSQSATSEIERLVEETTGQAVPEGVIHVDDRALGEGYGKPTPECIEAIRLLARLEGVFLDPVYTGKAMAGLIAWLTESKLSKNDNLVFVHTGGVPLLFAYAHEFT